MKKAFSLLPLILLACAAHAQNSWTNRFNGSGSANDEAYAIALDTNGNVFVTGYSLGSSSSYDYATIAYSNAGVPLWTNIYNGPGNSQDQATAIALDGSGNVFVTGFSASANGDYDYATIKYSNAGAPRWTQRYNGPGNGADLAYGIAADTNGNVFVTGYSASANGDYDYATIKYSNAGAPLWTNRCNGPGNGNDYARAIAVDTGGNVLVTGYVTGSGGDFDYATIKYSNAGAPLWTNIYNGTGAAIDEAWAIAADSGSNVIVTGVSYGSGSYDYATIKYSGAGVPLWTNRYDGPGNGLDQAKSLALDTSGNVLVTGWSTGSGSGYDFATIKYSGAGVPLWTNRYNGPGNSDDFATKVVADSGGNVFVTGYSTSGNGDFDYATIKYSSAGVPLWTNIYNGPGNNNDAAEAIAVDTGGDVFVTGYSTGTGGDYDYTTIKYAATTANAPFFVTTNGIFGFSNGLFGFDISGPAGSNVLIQASSNLQAWFPLRTNPLGAGPVHFSDTQSVTNKRRFYRAVLLP